MFNSVDCSGAAFVDFPNVLNLALKAPCEPGVSLAVARNERGSPPLWYDNRNQGSLHQGTYLSEFAPTPSVPLFSSRWRNYSLYTYGGGGIYYLDIYTDACKTRISSTPLPNSALRNTCTRIASTNESFMLVTPQPFAVGAQAILGSGKLPGLVMSWFGDVNCKYQYGAGWSSQAMFPGECSSTWAMIDYGGDWTDPFGANPAWLNWVQTSDNFCAGPPSVGEIMFAGHMGIPRFLYPNVTRLNNNIAQVCNGLRREVTDFLCPTCPFDNYFTLDAMVGERYLQVTTSPLPGLTYPGGVNQCARFRTSRCRGTLMT